MRVKVEQVPNALLALRWGVMVLALVALFVLEWSGVAPDADRPQRCKWDHRWK